MTKTEVFDLSIKIFGLYYLVRFFQHLFEVLGLMIGGSLMESAQVRGHYIFLTLLLVPMVDFVFAYVAIIKTEWLSTRLFKTDNHKVGLGVSKRGLLEVALAVIAVLALADTIPDLLGQQVNAIFTTVSLVASGLLLKKECWCGT